LGPTRMNREEILQGAAELPPGWSPAAFSAPGIAAGSWLPQQGPFAGQAGPPPIHAEPGAVQALSTELWWRHGLFASWTHCAEDSHTSLSTQISTANATNPPKPGARKHLLCLEKPPDCTRLPRGARYLGGRRCRRA